MNSMIIFNSSEGILERKVDSLRMYPLTRRSTELCVGCGMFLRSFELVNVLTASWTICPTCGVL